MCIRDSHYFLPGCKGSSEVYGKVIVKLVSQETTTDYTIQQLELSEDKSSSHGPTSSDHRIMTVTMFHYLCWPKHGTPQGTTALLELIKHINKKQISSGNKPITVMCKWVYCSLLAVAIAITSCKVVMSVPCTWHLNKVVVVMYLPSWQYQLNVCTTWHAVMVLVVLGRSSVSMLNWSDWKLREWLTSSSPSSLPASRGRGLYLMWYVWSSTSDSSHYIQLTHNWYLVYFFSITTFSVTRWWLTISMVLILMPTLNNLFK